ncbi:MAG: GerMN domain-containing protein [Acidimicrobiales bacterium]|nr:GerMN domain-containing protein [Acidimicrobiales bacterium]
MVNGTGHTTLTIWLLAARPVRMLLTNVIVVAGLLVASSCGIPVDNSTRDLAVDLPDALLPAAPTTTAPPTPTETVQIYLARVDEEDRQVLEPVDREIKGDGSINVILAEVFAGPSADEQDAGLVSPFAEGSAVIGTVLDGGLLEVHLDSLDGFPPDDSASNRLAFAMLVCTADQLVIGAEIDRVVVLLAGPDTLEAINVPVSDGEPPVEGAPVTCNNYQSFLPLQSEN